MALYTPLTEYLLRYHIYVTNSTIHLPLNTTSYMLDNVTACAYNITVAALSHTGPSRNNPSVCLGMYIHYWSRAQTACASQRENGSGERSGISWAHYPEVVKTNEIVRLLLICSTSLQQENLFTSIVYLYSYFFWSGFSVLNVGRLHCCNSNWFTRPFLLVWEGGVWRRDHVYVYSHILNTCCC